MEEYLEFAKRLVLEGGRIIFDNFEKAHQVEAKSDATPVTEVDRRINELIKDSIRQKYPEHGLLGEEENWGGGNEEFQWICDPLDDTKGFIKGIRNSMCMLGLSNGGKILLSAVYEPFNDELYWAIKGGGSYCNGRAINVGKQSLQGGIVMLGEKSAEVFIKGIQDAHAQPEMLSGTGFKCMKLARGYGCGILKIETDYHDIGPASLIIEEAGGLVTGLNGKALSFNQEIHGAILSNGVSHQELLEIANVTVNS